jgi:hypothetical protein
MGRGILVDGWLLGSPGTLSRKLHPRMIRESHVFARGRFGGLQTPQWPPLITKTPTRTTAAILRRRSRVESNRIREIERKTHLLELPGRNGPDEGQEEGEEKLHADHRERVGKNAI